MESRPNFPSTIVTEYVMVRVFLYVQKLEIQCLETQKSKSTLNRPANGHKQTLNLHYPLSSITRSLLYGIDHLDFEFQYSEKP